MIIMSHCGISVVTNVRLYDRQVKNGCAQGNLSGVYIINSYTFSDCELHCTWDRHVGYHEKYMNSGNTGVFKKNSECSSTHTHTHENSGTTSVCIEKATYQMNSVSGGRERQSLC